MQKLIWRRTFAFSNIMSIRLGCCLCVKDPRFVSDPLTWQGTIGNKLWRREKLLFPSKPVEKRIYLRERKVTPSCETVSGVGGGISGATEYQWHVRATPETLIYMAATCSSLPFQNSYQICYSSAANSACRDQTQALPWTSSPAGPSSGDLSVLWLPSLHLTPCVPDALAAKRVPVSGLLHFPWPLSETFSLRHKQGKPFVTALRFPYLILLTRAPAWMPSGPAPTPTQILLFSFPLLSFITPIPV